MKILGYLEVQYTQNMTGDRYHSLLKKTNILHVFSKSKSGSGDLKTLTQLSISEITLPVLINTVLLSSLPCVRGVSVFSLIFLPECSFIVSNCLQFHVHFMLVVLLLLKVSTPGKKASSN